MAGRIVLFGATGYTGRLTAEALVERGAKPLLAGRNAESLEELAKELGGGLDTAQADVSDPRSVGELVTKDDVMVSTVGPFAKWGGPAIEAAIRAGAAYLDSTGEGTFIRQVFERYTDLASRSGSGLLTAFGYDWVPGNLAAALALRDAGESAVRVAVGYYATGTGMAGMSGGTQASAAGVMLDPSFAFRDGAVRTERNAKRVASFDVGGRKQPAVSVGSSEHFALPQSFPHLREVDAYLGWFGPASRPMQALSAGLSAVAKVPGSRKAISGALGKLVKGSTGGPGPEERAKSGSQIVAVAYDDDGQALASARVEGVDGYTYTGRILAWGAITALEGGLRGSGALGPVKAFGLDELERGSAQAGIERVA
ncbi:MAG TPA: saccharopine dehydrogenase NADP-binding domain-containing protein [Thermoleophilaceae bacterium]|nr:saccharopine dehydrogenase NADP-binding domain-containing protein [Thermoleophilaceae bacterium]